MINPESYRNQLSIDVVNLSKRFNKEWIFKDLNYTFHSGKTYAITGPNGSGKSTLMQILWGQLPQTSGLLNYKSDNTNIPIEEIYSQVSVATPYMDLIEEFTLEEQLCFHFRMRTIRKGFTIESLLDKLYLTPARDKHIANFSSGMKQRLKLGLAFYTASSVLFLDEPGSNLDDQAFAWYLENLKQLPSDQLIFIASNQRNEYPENAEVLNLVNFK
ncbi:MAG TPA: ATP-binding cassette domain-containing protein [Cyclobacteriaceae bacterium]|nr:ATP-binding cassette domain-containing protein [Cyclobacteriaceae bacterium]